MVTRLRVELGKWAYFLNVITPKSFTNEYEYFDVKDEIVVDAGANIGDTAIYFIERGARKVIAYEASWPVCMRGLRELNKRHYVKEGKVVMIHRRVEDLNKIIKENNLKDAILKMDIEGGEYECIDSVVPESFRLAFKSVMMEYHNKYEELKKWFETNGYEVHILELSPVLGMLYAKRSGNPQL